MTKYLLKVNNKDNWTRSMDSVPLFMGDFEQAFAYKIKSEEIF